MWTTGTSLMIARLTGSTLYTNHNVLSSLTFDQRSASTATTTTENSNVVMKMRDLRARNPYALFIKDNYNQISAKHPNLKLADVTKKVAEAWKSLSDEKKQNYIKKYEDQKLHYEEEKKRLSPNDLQLITADEKAKRIENRVKKSIQQLPTKRPRSAYVHFLTTLDRGEADIGTFSKGAAKLWAQMSIQDKQKFEDLHREEKDKYNKALVAWALTKENETKPAIARRSKSAVASTKTKDTLTRKSRGTSATGKRTVKKRTAATTTTKSTKTKSSSDRKPSPSSSSSSDDESTGKSRKSPVQKKS